MGIIIKILAVVFYLLALLVMAVAVIGMVGGWKQKKRCVGKTTGVVSRMHEEFQGDGKKKTKVYFPEFRYQVGNKTYTQKAPFSDMKKTYQVGQEIAIHYDPQDPNVYDVGDGFGTAVRSGVICILVALVLIYIGTQLMF